MFKTPRLLIITDHWLPQTYSIVNFYVKCVAQARHEGWNVEVIDPSRVKDIAVIESYIANTINTFLPDYIHLSCSGSLSDMAARYCFENQIRFTSTYHTDMPGFWSTAKKGNFDNFIRMVKRYYQNHELVYTHSASAAENMRRHGIGLNQAVWWPAVDSDNFDTPRVKKISRTRPRLLSVGRVTQEKNLDTFCQLDSDRYELILVGDGVYLDELKQKYPHVQFLGRKQGKELGQIYADADCFVFTSQFDTLGIVNAEAPWAGTPTAAFPAQGVIDVVEQGVNGYCNEDLEQAIQDCLKLDRRQVAEFTRGKWTWGRSWSSLKKDLIKTKGEQHENNNQKDVRTQQTSGVVG